MTPALTSATVGLCAGLPKAILGEALALPAPTSADHPRPSKTLSTTGQAMCRTPICSNCVPRRAWRWIIRISLVVLIFPLILQWVVAYLVGRWAEIEEDLCWFDDEESELRRTVELNLSSVWPSVFVYGGQDFFPPVSGGAASSMGGSIIKRTFGKVGYSTHCVGYLSLLMQES